GQQPVPLGMKAAGAGEADVAGASASREVILPDASAAGPEVHRFAEAALEPVVPNLQVLNPEREDGRAAAAARRVPRLERKPLDHGPVRRETVAAPVDHEDGL